MLPSGHWWAIHGPQMRPRLCHWFLPSFLGGVPRYQSSSLIQPSSTTTVLRCFIPFLFCRDQVTVPVIRFISSGFRIQSTPGRTIHQPEPVWYGIGRKNTHLQWSPILLARRDTSHPSWRLYFLSHRYDGALLGSLEWIICQDRKGLLCPRCKRWAWFFWSWGNYLRFSRKNPVKKAKKDLTNAKKAQIIDLEAKEK